MRIQLHVYVRSTKIKFICRKLGRHVHVQSLSHIISLEMTSQCNDSASCSLLLPLDFQSKNSDFCRSVTERRDGGLKTFSRADVDLMS